MSAGCDENSESIVKGSGDVFVDLGIQVSDLHMLKVAVAHAITITVQNRNLTQAEAAKLVGTDQAKMSNILRGRVRGFTVERLFKYLLYLGRNLDIHISDAQGDEHGRVRIVA